MIEIKVFLLTVLYFLGNSTAFTMGVGYYTIYRSLVSGALVGIILGNLEVGILAGAAVNMIYINFVSTGGSLKGDPCLTAIMAALFSIIYKFSFISSIAPAYVFGMLGVILLKYRMHINSMFVKKYEKKYKLGKMPNITIYNVVLPQAFLYILSTIVVIFCLGFFYFIKPIMNIYYDKLNYIFFIGGVFLIVSSNLTMFLNTGKFLSVIPFFIAAGLTIIFPIRSSFVFLIISIFFIINVVKDINIYIPKENVNTKIGKKDLIYSWIIWMNFSHSCYSKERLQGLGFAHSMKNIVKKLHKDENIQQKIIHDNAEYFNTEPNVGTPIHGYVISMEEKNVVLDKCEDVSYMKKAMMGNMAGLGDSFTQVVLTPLFIGMAIMLSVDNCYKLAFIPILLLAFSIIYISYTGFMEGYKNKDSILKRIKQIKNSKIKKYFPYIFSAVIGVSTAKLIIKNEEMICNNFISVLVTIIVANIVTIWKNKRCM